VVLRDSNSSLAFTAVPYLCHRFDRQGAYGAKTLEQIAVEMAKAKGVKLPPKLSVTK